MLPTVAVQALPGVHGCAVPSCTLAPAQHQYCITITAWTISPQGHMVSTALEHTQWDKGNPFSPWQSHTGMAGNSLNLAAPRGQGRSTRAPERPGRRAGEDRALQAMAQCWPWVCDTSEAVRGSSPRDKVRLAAARLLAMAKGAATVLPTPSSLRALAALPSSQHLGLYPDPQQDLGRAGPQNT